MIDCQRCGATKEQIKAHPCQRCGAGRNKYDRLRAEAKLGPMQVPDFQVGDKVKTVSGWHGVIVKKHDPKSHRGYKVQWTDTRGHRFTKPGDTSDLTPLNLFAALGSVRIL